MIETEFNAEIARMVDDVTEKEKDLPWLERKLAALEHIKVMKHDSILVKSADVLHNMNELIQDIQAVGLAVFEKFNASQDDVITRLVKLVAEISRVYPENPLNSDLNENLKTLLKIIDQYRE